MSEQDLQQQFKELVKQVTLTMSELLLLVLNSHNNLLTIQMDQYAQVIKHSNDVVLLSVDIISYYLYLMMRNYKIIEQNTKNITIIKNIMEQLLSNTK